MEDSPRRIGGTKGLREKERMKIPRKGVTICYLCLEVCEVVENYKTHPIICGCCGEKIACPNCGNTERVRSWGAKERTVALCYDCGAIFWADSGEILTYLEGDKQIWGAMGMAFACLMG